MKKMTGKLLAAFMALAVLTGGMPAYKAQTAAAETTDVYVAGQTAPGDGITLIKHDFGGMCASDVVIRGIRVRVGDSNGESTGGMGLGSCNHSIVDHCSISWATDEGFRRILF